MRDIALCALLSSIPTIYWHSRVNSIVTEPYLDEIFHVRQAQLYCQGKFSQWDSKITTPPGLYLLSYIVYLLTGACDLSALRAINIFPGCSVLSYLILKKCRKESRKPGKIPIDKNQIFIRDSAEYNDLHTAINISLFPPLFFFTSLYYTDVLSVQFVLLHHLLAEKASFGAGSTLPIWIIGLVALLFRQTNLFWVAIFHGALVALQVLKEKSSTITENYESKPVPLTTVIYKSLRDQTLYDVCVQDAQFEDFLKVTVSIAIIAVIRMKSIIYSAIPYLALCMVFAAYVVWNGGVVLGDKSNHVATLHVPQMLYIWPYIAFFSFPLLIPIISCYVLKALPMTFLKCLPHHLPNIDCDRDFQMPRFKVYLISLVLSMITVRFNTIVHPFTLADNRHYVFYVFRILRWHPYVKYLAASICVACVYVCILAIGCIIPRHKLCRKKRTKQSDDGTTLMEVIDRDRRQHVSFVIIWLTATSLSVISAPLVEPRYFIIPWVFWRLNVHSHGESVSASKAETSSQKTNLNIDIDRSTNTYLWMETGWYIIINAVIGYIFLHQGFEWEQEPGTVQRFIW